MSPSDARSIAKLQAKLTASRNAVRIARENLIEALGDHICGSGSGPTPKDLQVLANASRREAKILLELAELATAAALLDCRKQPQGSTESLNAKKDAPPQKR